MGILPSFHFTSDRRLAQQRAIVGRCDRTDDDQVIEHCALECDFVLCSDRCRRGLH